MYWRADEVSRWVWKVRWWEWLQGRREWSHLTVVRQKQQISQFVQTRFLSSPPLFASLSLPSEMGVKEVRKRQVERRVDSMLGVIILKRQQLNMTCGIISCVTPLLYVTGTKKTNAKHTLVHPCSLLLHQASSLLAPFSLRCILGIETSFKMACWDRFLGHRQEAQNRQMKRSWACENKHLILVRILSQLVVGWCFNHII